MSVRRIPPRPKGAESEAFGSSWSASSGALRLPLLGIVLVLVGAALLLRELLPGLSFTGIFLLALGVVLAALALTGRGRWALVPGLLLLGYAVPRVLVDVGALRGGGWVALGLAAALLAVWLIGRSRRRHGWALLPAALLAVYAATQLSGQLPGVPDLSAVWPLLLIVAGVAVIATASRREAARPW